jgi:hypothetical protein
MRTGKLALAVLMTAGVSAAADPSVEVHVYVRGGQHVDLLVTRGAQHRASEMLRLAGVRVVWKTGRLSSVDCCKPQLVMRYGADPSRPPDVLAYAFPYGNGMDITILYRRIVANRRRPEKVLAHVIVHEVTHVLQGVAGHSDSGIMKAWWTPKDYEQMERAPLPFTANDIALIQLGLAKRIAKVSNANASRYNSPVLR